jgi:hypothetical protein
MCQIIECRKFTRLMEELSKCHVDNADVGYKLEIFTIGPTVGDQAPTEFKQQ